MSIDTGFDMADYFGNCGMSMSGYDVAEIERAINSDMAEYFSSWKEVNPEPDEGDYSHSEADYDRFDRDHDAWESDAAEEMSDYFEARIQDTWPVVFESNYDPTEFLAKELGFDEKDLIDAVSKKLLEPEDLDSIVERCDEIINYDNRELTIDDVRAVIAKF